MLLGAWFCGRSLVLAFVAISLPPRRLHKRLVHRLVSSLVPKRMGSGVYSSLRRFCLNDDVQSQMISCTRRRHKCSFKQALRSQAKKFKTIVAVVDASALAGLRKHWNTPIPLEVKDLVEELATDSEIAGEISNRGDKKRMLSGKPVVAVGAGATAI
ncbi:hypothetical protein NL676_019324 [Syzygium grande]|nr:hypothetical protein NL676_019324 [Syzygium grande]